MRGIHREVRRAVDEMLAPFAGRITWSWDQKEKHPFLLIKQQNGPSGKVYYPSTPSDHRWIDNFLTEVRHRLLQLGILDEADFAKPVYGGKTVMQLKLQEALDKQREARRLELEKQRASEREEQSRREEPEPAQPQAQAEPEPQPIPAELPPPIEMHPALGFRARLAAQTGRSPLPDVDMLSHIVVGAIEHMLTRYIIDQDHKIADLERQLRDLEDAMTRPGVETVT